jgi:hypothetical protein
MGDAGWHVGVLTPGASLFAQDCSFPAYFYTQPMATGPGFYDNLCPQSWQDGSAATFTLQDPHQQSKFSLILLVKGIQHVCFLFVLMCAEESCNSAP